MSDIRPAGAPLKFAGIKYELLFTVNVIDEVQDAFDIHIDDLITLLGDSKSRDFRRNVAKILTYLINEAILIKSDETGEEPKLLTEEYVRRHLSNVNMSECFAAICSAYSLSFLRIAKEEDDIGEEDEDPNATSG